MKQDLNRITGAIVMLFALSALAAVSALLLRRRKAEPPVSVKAENRFEQTLHAVTDRDYEPFSYIGRNGSYAGLDVELIAEVANRLQMNLDFTLLDWTDAKRYFEDGGADVFLNMETDTVAKTPGMIATIPTAEKQYVVYGRRAVSSVAELYGTRIASLHQMPELGIDSDITYIDSYAEIFSALSRGEFDFAICPVQVGNVFVHKMNLSDIKPSCTVGHIYGAIALSASNEELCERINGVLADLWREGFMSHLERKWISRRYQNATMLGMLRSNPWILVVFAAMVLVTLFFAVSFVFQQKSRREREAYMERLKNNLATINKQSAELLEAKNKAEASSRAKTVFLSNMSHDIRTPMNAIIGYTSLARKNGATMDEIQGFLEKIDASSKYLLALINDVLEMSRIESGRLEVEEEPCDLNLIMDDMRDMFSAQMEAKNISYTVDASGLKNPHVLCNRTRLNRVLLNLIGNAYKFTEEGGKVYVSLFQTAIVDAHPAELVAQEGGVAQEAQDGGGKRVPDPKKQLLGHYELRVRDTGIGMSAEFAKKVFDAFERERTSTVSGIQGTGLGMAITKSIIDLMGGEISVHTEKGKGTEFVIKLCLKILHDTECGQKDGPAQAKSVPKESGGGQETEAPRTEQAQNSVEPRTPPAQEKTASAGGDDFSGTRLLLVDDMDVNRELATMILESRGFAVETATNGREAVEQVAKADAGYYSAVLMDIQMPVLDGYGAAKEIRALQDKAKAAVPIVAMTANAFEEDRQNAFKAGMNAHVAKPIDETQLFSVLSQVCRA
ncbi:MAG: response regulator [Treponema sp.]|nr:response regulator [Treponema sp.]